MNEILKALAYCAADENSSFNPIAKYYRRTGRAAAAYEALSNQFADMGLSLDMVNQLNDSLCEVSEAFAEQGFLNGAVFGAELERELKGGDFHG